MKWGRLLEFSGPWGKTLGHGRKIPQTLEQREEKKEIKDLGRQHNSKKREERIL